MRGWCSLCTRQPVSLSLSLSIFFFLRLNSRSSNIYTYARLVDNDRQRRDFPLLCSLHNVKRKTREGEEEGDKEEKKLKEKNVDEQCSSRTRLVKCTMKPFASDRHRIRTRESSTSLTSLSEKQMFREGHFFLLLLFLTCTQRNRLMMRIKTNR